MVEITEGATQSTSGAARQSAEAPSIATPPLDVSGERQRILINAGPTVTRLSPTSINPSVDTSNSVNAIPEALRPLHKQLSAEQGFASLSKVQQRQLLEAVDLTLRYTENLGDRAEFMGNVRALLISPEIVASKLLAKDATGEGRATLDHLHILATHERALLSAGVGAQRDELIRSVVAEIADSEANVNQGVYSTCVPTVANRFLADNRPAEYVRIIQELVTTGRCELVRTNPATGELERETSFTLYFDEWSTTPGALRDRSLSESIFQTSAMKMVGGFENGLYNNQIEVLYEALFGQPFMRLDQPGVAIEELHNATRNDSPNMVSLKWEAAGAHANHALEVLGVFSARDVTISEGKEILQVRYGDTRMDIPVDDALRRALRQGDVVLNRNPWGETYPNPKGVGAHTIDQERAIFWMKSSEFESRLNFAFVADQNPQATIGVTEGGEWNQGKITKFVTDKVTIGGNLLESGILSHVAKNRRGESADRGGSGSGLTGRNAP